MATRESQLELVALLRALRSLPFDVYKSIADLVDQQSALGNAYMTLGYMLGYTLDQCRTNQARARCSDFNYSPTQALLEDYMTNRNGSIERLQYALVTMNHRAQSVIPEYLQAISQHQWRDDGVQNTESSICPCPGCNAPVFHMPPTRNQSNSSHQSAVHQQTMSSNTADTVQETVNDKMKHLNPSSTPSCHRNSVSTHSSQDDGHTKTQGAQGHISTSINNHSLQQCRPTTTSTNTLPKQMQAPFPPEGRPANGQVPPSSRPPVVGRSTHSLVNPEQPCPIYPHGAGPQSQQYTVLPRVNHSNEVYNDCEKCRLSNPDETLVLTTGMSPPRPGCPQHSDLNDCSQQFNQLNISVDQRRQRPPNCARNVNFSASSGSQTDANSSARHRVNSANVERTASCQSSHDNIHDPGINSQRQQQQQANNPKRNTWPSDEDCDRHFDLGQSSASSEGSVFNSNERHSHTENGIEEIHSRLSFNETPSNSSDPNFAEALDTDGVMDEMCTLNQNNSKGWTNEKKKCKQTKRKSDFILVTFSYNANEDDEHHLREIMQMCKHLKAAGIRVKIDMDPDTFDALRLNKQDWLDRMTSEAKYVIVCLSPAYLRDTQNFPINNQANPGEAQLNARYIFNHLRAEYHNNGCRNRRMIPVMFTNSGVSQTHIPQCMRSTLSYNYPEEVREIVRVIKGERGEEFHLPYRQ